MYLFRNQFLIGLLSFLLIFTLIGCGEDEDEEMVPESAAVAPWGVAVAGQKVYVCNTAYDGASNSYGDGTVSVIDSSTDEVVKTIDVETNPTEIVVSGDKIIVQCTGNYADITGNLCVIDVASDTVAQVIDLGMTPSGLAISPNGKVYITTFGGLLSVDIGSGTVAGPLADFGGGSGLAFDGDGNGYIAVPDWTGAGDDKLLVMDSSESLIGTYVPGGGASIIAIRNSSAVYIINGTAETLSVFDVKTSEMENDVLTVGKWPNDIQIAGSNAYVVNTGDNNVQIIDLESLTESGVIDVGQGTGPEKIGFVDDKAYVSCNYTASVNVVDLTSGQVTKSIELGIAP